MFGAVFHHGRICRAFKRTSGRCASRLLLLVVQDVAPSARKSATARSTKRGEKATAATAAAPDDEVSMPIVAWQSFCEHARLKAGKDGVYLMYMYAPSAHGKRILCAS